jgi:prepilin-type N-terminal cleavage/methylation domain-containing protein
MRKIKLFKNEDGLTLLEVMIAMLIMSLSLLLLLNMAVVAIHGNDWSAKTTVATQMLQQKLEQMRNIQNLGSADGGSDTGNGVSRVWKVSDAGNHLRQVDVYVSWENIKGETKTNAITTFIKTDSI